MAYGIGLAGRARGRADREFQIRGAGHAGNRRHPVGNLIGAEVVCQEGKLGVIAPGAFADMLVVDGDPLKDLGLFEDGGCTSPPS